MIAARSRCPLRLSAILSATHSAMLQNTLLSSSLLLLFIYSLFLVILTLMLYNCPVLFALFASVLRHQPTASGTAFICGSFLRLLFFFSRARFCFCSSLLFLIPLFLSCSFSLPWISIGNQYTRSGLIKKRTPHRECRSSVPSALRRLQQPRPIRLVISPRMSLSIPLRKTVSPIFDSPLLVNTLPSRPGIRRCAFTRSMSRDRVKERLFLSMRLPS